MAQRRATTLLIGSKEFNSFFFTFCGFKMFQTETILFIQHFFFQNVRRTQIWWFQGVGLLGDLAGDSAVASFFQLRGDGLFGSSAQR